MSGSDIWQELLSGNKRFVEGNPTHPNQSLSRRREMAKGQSPRAAVLACADSRVSPEIIFDQGLGDLFVVRVAGNVVNDPILGSLEYAVEHLGTQLIVVLGHQRCGAVAAACAGGEAPGHIASLVQALAPAVDKISASHNASEKGRVDLAAKENVRMTVKSLHSCGPILAEWVRQGKLEVTGAFYDLDTGAVEIVE
ncbi:MAG: carbonic anhydrase [Nitrospinae bacterium]|nr:carbonic anhydrase [Nitrospinota bacterium]